MCLPTLLTTLLQAWENFLAFPLEQEIKVFDYIYRNIRDHQDEDKS